MNKQELNEARTNPDFLKYLEETRVDALNTKNISALYEVLDSMLILDLEESKINEVYEEILKISFTNVEKIVNSGKKLKLKDKELFYVRSFYEHAIEKWSFQDIEGAKQLFFVLYNIIDDERLEDALKIHVIALSKGMDLDTFYEKKVDVNSVLEDDSHGYFIVNFNFAIKVFLKQNSDVLKKEHENLKYLLD
ncbi:hypothetical protein CP960_02460 [Malaciobacter halophilus]|uniref:Uncharacterized protein n=1 Tax=Malaciobacter halophilus TaxID=197482 RepID=A0A2N1J5E7_9BACT|nr:hypothetical protein [Malaciobacter halophilus]AXH10733.1 hypothetical protein AHALO_2403 [Malaciobacter halophilus]PKI81756.1 hypothetical protein CP960_02460 [Malaciobacter halophilus]